MNQLPLERILTKLYKKGSVGFPPNVDYDSRYKNLFSDLKATVYTQINASLSAERGGIYTDHGPDHFREVIHYAGLLLGLDERNGKLPTGMTPYDVYLLLVAILLHDAGNIGGRNKHEERTNEVFSHFKTLAHDKNEIRLVADIARAHGGKTSTGDKDTITGRLRENDVIQSAKCHPQFVAAVARFADEICESRNRAAAYHLATNTLPAQSTAYHHYADSIRNVTFEPSTGTVRIGYSVDVNDLSKTLQSEKGETYISDEILDRLDKMELERRFCSQFTRGFIKLDRILVHIDIVKQNDVIKIFDIELPERGYPKTNNSLRVLQPDLLHEALIEALGDHK